MPRPYPTAFDASSVYADRRPIARAALYAACAAAATAGVTTQAQQPGAKFQTSIRPAQGQNTGEHERPPPLARLSHLHGYHRRSAKIDVPVANQTLRGIA